MSTKSHRSSMPEIFDVPPPPAAVMQVAHELETELARSFETTLAHEGEERSGTGA